MKKSLGFIFLILFLVEGVSAIDYYVSPTGSGTVCTLSSPCSLATANSNVLAGDTIMLFPGTYNSPITISKSGTPENYITIKSYYSDSSQWAVIDGGGSFGQTGHNGFNLGESDWLKFENLKMRNCWRFVWYGTGNQYIWIKNVDVLGGGVLLKFEGSGSHHILFEDSVWEKYQPIWDSISWSDCHDDYGNCNGAVLNFVSEGNKGNAVIRNNEIYYAYNPFRLEAESSNDFANIEIYGNYVHHCIDNAVEPEGNMFNLHIYHNQFDQIGGGVISLDNVNGGPFLFYGNTGYYDPNDEPGAPIGWTRTRRFVKWTDSGQNYADDLIRIFHNTFFYREFQEKTDNNENENIKFYNNIGIFWSVGWNFDGLSLDNNEFDYDCSYGYNPLQSLFFPDVYGWESHGIEANPQVIDPINGDFRVQLGSPVVNNGKIISDFTQSYEGSAPDIGAYEGDVLVEGPPFYVMTPSAGLGYVEKPRITRHRISGNQLTIFFSWPIQPSTISSSSIILFADGVAVTINSVSMGSTNMEVIISTDTDLEAKNLDLSFSSMPIGENGEDATMWASTLSTPSQTCSQLGGLCCTTGQQCSGGTFQSASDCSSLCCVGGTCTNPTTIFSTLDSYLGDSANWEPLTPSRWAVIDDGGDLKYGIIASDYSNLSGSRLGEYSLIKNRVYDDFVFNASVKSTEDLGSNPSADYDIVFGYQDASNYYYMMFNAYQPSNQLFRVVSGERELIVNANNLVIPDNLYHDVALERSGDEIRVFFDGDLKLSASDSTFSSGRVGIGGYNDASLWDDVLVLSGITTCSSGADLPPYDNVVSISELLNYISAWKSGTVTISELLTGISEWKNGC